MTLYEMLDKAMAHQKVWIYENNTYDQNMPLFQGTVNDARIDPEIVVWDYLMCQIEYYDCSCGILDIRVRSENYGERFEKHYVYGDEWERDKSKRPWRYSIEISEEKRDYENRNRNTR